MGVLLCGALMLAAGCGKKTSSGSTAPEAETDESSLTVTTVTAAETTAVTTTAAAVQTTTAAADPDKGFPDVMSAAEHFYKAYVEHDADAVYAMFDRSEMEGYYKNAEAELDGASPKEVFRRAAVIRAIIASMDNIGEIMDYYADTGNDKWTYSLKEEDLKEITEEELNDFNKSMGTSYTKAMHCPYMFYKDETNNASFTGNSSAFLERGGKWYLSFSTAMGTDLINFIELE